MQFFRGVSASSDPRVGSSLSKDLKRVKEGGPLPPEYSLKVDLKKVQRPLIDSFISQRITHYLKGFEDEVLINTVSETLWGGAGSVTGQQKSAVVDPCELQVLLLPFLENNARTFVAELWSQLASATANPHGEFLSLLCGGGCYRRCRRGSSSLVATACPQPLPLPLQASLRLCWKPRRLSCSPRQRLQQPLRRSLRPLPWQHRRHRHRHRASTLTLTLTLTLQ